MAKHLCTAGAVCMVHCSACSTYCAAPLTPSSVPHRHTTEGEPLFEEDTLPFKGSFQKKNVLAFEEAKDMCEPCWHPPVMSLTQCALSFLTRVRLYTPLAELYCHPQNTLPYPLF